MDLIQSNRKPYKKCLRITYTAILEIYHRVYMNLFLSKAAFSPPKHSRKNKK